MNKLRLFSILYAITALVVAVVTTVAQTQPALFFIELTLSDGKFPITLVFLLTALLLLLPGLLLIQVIGLLNRPKNEIPDITGKTGIILHRKRILQSGIYIYPVLLDGEKRGRLGNGQSIFLEASSGQHTIKLGGIKSSEYSFDLPHGKVLKLETCLVKDGLKANVIIIPSAELAV